MSLGGNLPSSNFSFPLSRILGVVFKYSSPTAILRSLFKCGLVSSERVVFESLQEVNDGGDAKLLDLFSSFVDFGRKDFSINVDNIDTKANRVGALEHATVAVVCTVKSDGHGVQEHLCPSCAHMFRKSSHVQLLLAAHPGVQSQPVDEAVDLDSPPVLMAESHNADAHRPVERVSFNSLPPGPLSSLASCVNAINLFLSEGDFRVRVPLPFDVCSRSLSPSALSVRVHGGRSCRRAPLR